jgi:5-methyltetrahydrofolate--homocysteine methyltransferase
MFALGLQHGDAPELWNLGRPDLVSQHYRSFVEAGADIVLTNTFGGTANRLKLHGAEDRVFEINRRAAELLRAVIEESGREVVCAGSVGPTGDLFEPLGALTYDEGVAAFAEQCRGLAAGGADVAWIETMSAPEELKAALEGAAQAELPVVCTMSFDTNGRTMMGLAPAQLSALASELAPAPLAFGGNCGTGAAELVVALKRMHDAARDTDVLVAKANCGIPEFVGDSIEYNGTPELMARYAVLARDAGARIIGGCCGTTPEHIRQMKAALEATPCHAAPSLEEIVAELGEVSAKGLAEENGEGKAPGRSSSRRARRRERPSA